MGKIFIRHFVLLSAIFSNRFGTFKTGNSFKNRLHQRHILTNPFGSSQIIKIMRSKTSIGMSPSEFPEV
jgi:hypothetical protein